MYVFFALARFFILIAVFSACISCDKGASEKVAIESFNFVESSSGLPAEGQWRHSVCFSDINGDGFVDILAPPPRKAAEVDQRPFIWLGNGKGEWASASPKVPKSIPYAYGGIAAGDFNNDGIQDMALAPHVLGLTGLKGQGDIQYSAFSEGLVPRKDFSSRALTSADFNNDGFDDIAAISEGEFRGQNTGVKDGVVVCLGGPTQWHCRPVVDEAQMQGLFGDQIVTGDVNGDGNMDIANCSYEHRKTLIVWLGDGKGGFTPFNHGLITQRHYNSVALADLNGDGRDDLIAGISGFKNQEANRRLLKAYLSGNDGFKDASEGLPENEVYYAVSTGDLDGDGVPEIVAATGPGAFHVYSQKNGKWHRIKTFGLPEGGLWHLYNIYCLDVNGDGLDDIALNYATEKNNAGGIRVFLNVPAPKK